MAGRCFERLIVVLLENQMIHHMRCNKLVQLSVSSVQTSYFHFLFSCEIQI